MSTPHIEHFVDERGLEWDGESYESVTFWNEETNLAVASDDRDGKLWMSLRVTPAQAIEATLGRGTCEVESMHGYTDPYTTTRYVVELSCHTLDDWPESEPPAYCPWCGAKVVGDASVD